MPVRYEMVELAAVVGKLAEKENGYESTSISYEKAGQMDWGSFYGITPQTYMIGDCEKPRKIQEATMEGYTIASTL